MKTLKIAFGATLLFLVTSCTSSGVFVDFDPSQRFDNYQSFSWVSEQPMLVEGDRGPNPLVAKRLMDAIKSSFEANGYTFTANADAADFVVSFTVGARDKVNIREHKVQEYIDPQGVIWRRDPLGFSPRLTTSITEIREYTEGMLAIDVYDVRNKKPVWHGGAKKRLSREELEESAPESIKTGVAAIVQNFPPDLSGN